MRAIHAFSKANDKLVCQPNTGGVTVAQLARLYALVVLVLCVAMQHATSNTQVPGPVSDSEKLTARLDTLFRSLGLGGTSEADRPSETEEVTSSDTTDLTAEHSKHDQQHSALAEVSSSRVGLSYDPLMEGHIPLYDHVECPERTATLYALLQSTGLALRCINLPTRKVTDAELLRVHTAAHIQKVKGCLTDPTLQLDPFGDNYCSAGTPEAASLAAGNVVQAVQSVMSGHVNSAFAVVRPPGHHAECDRALGFCFFNNVAVAAVEALRAGADRVLILDWDVHHGNGIQHMMAADPRILYCSLHRHNGFYPGTGSVAEVGVGAAEGYTVNVAWPRGGLGDADYAAAFDLVLMPLFHSFAPDLVLVSAGFDAAEGDPLGGMRLTPAGYARMTWQLLQLAGGRVPVTNLPVNEPEWVVLANMKAWDVQVVAALEGGYNLRMTAECAVACVRELLGEGDDAAVTPGRVPTRPSHAVEGVLASLVQAQAPYWEVLRPLASPKAFRRRWADYLLSLETRRSLRLQGPEQGKADPKSRVVDRKG